LEQSDRATLNPSLWVKSYGDALFSFTMLRVGNRQVAEDIVQETFISALKAKDEFKGESKEQTWLMAILKNKIIDYYRKKDVLKNARDYLEETQEEFYGNFFDPSNGHWLQEAAPRAFASNADAGLNHDEFLKVVQFCIQKMPSKLVPVFVAKFLDDEDSEKICKDYNLSPSNYWVIIHRAKVLVRACLEKNWL
jgi:RNA polymerase sigma-70 factor (TIGR02943 family)